MARPRASSGIPLCNSGEGCGAIDTVNPLATYAVPRVPVRRDRGESGWRGRVSAGHRMPLYVFPMQPKGHLPGNFGDRAPEARRVPTWHLASRPGASRRTELSAGLKALGPTTDGGGSPTAACRACQRLSAASRSGGAVRIGCAASRAQGSARPRGRRSASAGSAG